MKHILILTLILTNLLSAPAYNAKRVFKQANGDEFIGRANGNHHLNWIEDENGEILKYNHKTKNYDYAAIEGSDLKASGYRYKKQNNNKSIAKEQRKIRKIQRKELSDLMIKRKKLKAKELYK